MNTHVTEEEAEYILAMWNIIGNVSYVAAEVGRSIPTVRKYLAEAGVTHEEVIGRWRSRSWDEGEVDQAVDMYLYEGKSIRDIAHVLGKSYNVVRAGLLREGVKLRRRGVNYTLYPDKIDV